MGMTREDVLRDLELLPVWQQRMPIVSPIEIVQKITEIQKTAEATVAETSYYVVVSDDKKWVRINGGLNLYNRIQIVHLHRP